MSRLPVIVGFGGYNAAGRSSFHHGFRRTVQESLAPQARQETLAGLAQMIAEYRDPETPYLSRPRVQFLGYPGDYDHLARVPEGSVRDSGEGEA